MRQHHKNSKKKKKMKEKKRKAYSTNGDSIWSAALADMQLIIKDIQRVRFLLCIIKSYCKHTQHAQTMQLPVHLKNIWIDRVVRKTRNKWIRVLSFTKNQ